MGGQREGDGEHRLRRAVIAALAAILLATTLVGCGGGDDPEKEAARPSSTAPPTTDAPPVTTPTTAASSTTTTEAPTTAPASTATTAPPTVTPAATGLSGRVVVIDPGHNGANGSHTSEINRTVDAGGFQKACNTTGTAGANGLSESSFNWQVAGRLAERLRAAGATVILTRQDDDGWGPCIDERGQIAARADADLLLSIHADGASPSGHGFHVIHPGPVPGYTDGRVDTSAAFAAALRDALVAEGLTTSTYIGSEGLDERTDLGTLNRADGVVAAMVESGNMRNADDLALLSSPDGQDRLADAFAAAITAQLSTPG